MYQHMVRNYSSWIVNVGLVRQLGMSFFVCAIYCCIAENTVIRISVFFFFFNYNLHTLVREHLRNMHVFLSISKFVVFISTITMHRNLKV